MSGKKIPLGYKKTEIGIIPEDWKVKKLGEIFEIKRGASPRPIEKYTTNKSDGINWIKISDVSPNDKYLEKTEVKITHDGAEQSVYVYPGDLILSNSMSYGRPYISKIKGCIHDGWLLLKQKMKVDIEFFYYLLASSRVKKDFDLMAAGSGVNNLKIDSVEKLSVQIPTLSEQRAIARVLSDVDKLIESLDRLIEKKKLIKKGAMQELLTGKKRLPGFKEEWVRKKLGELVTISKGQGLSKSKLSDNGKYECILYGELFTTYKEVIKEIKSKTNYLEGIPSKYGDILFPSSTTTTGIDLAKASTVLKDNVLLGGDIIILRSVNEFDPVFLTYYLNEVKKYDIAEKTSGITIYHLYGRDLIDLVVSLPPTLEEQQAIAQILSDMDAEIEALEKKKAKYEMLKKGMMQLLLTGKVRLKDKIKEVLK